MLELKTPYSFTGVPYLTNESLEEYAESIIADFA